MNLLLEYSIHFPGKGVTLFRDCFSGCTVAVIHLPKGNVGMPNKGKSCCALWGVLRINPENRTVRMNV